MTNTNFVKKLFFTASLACAINSCGNSEVANSAKGGEIKVSIDKTVENFDEKNNYHLDLIKKQNFKIPHLVCIHGYISKADAAEITFERVSKYFEGLMQKENRVYMTPIILDDRKENVNKSIKNQAELCKEELLNYLKKILTTTAFSATPVFTGTSQGSAIAHELFKDKTSFLEPKYISIMGSPTGCFLAKQTVSMGIDKYLPIWIKDLSSNNREEGLNRNNCLLIGGVSKNPDDVIDIFIPETIEGFLRNLTIRMAKGLLNNEPNDGCFSLEDISLGHAKIMEDLEKPDSKERPMIKILENTNHIEPLGWGKIGTEEQRKAKADEICEKIASWIFEFLYINNNEESKIEEKFEEMNLS